MTPNTRADLEDDVVETQLGGSHDTVEMHRVGQEVLAEALFEVQAVPAE